MDSWKRMGIKSTASGRGIVKGGLDAIEDRIKGTGSAFIVNPSGSEQLLLVG